MGLEASEAARCGDQRTLYALFSQLKGRGLTDRRDTGHWSADQVEQEREQWRSHFEAISADAGSVADRVWNSVPQSLNQETWLDDVPDDGELDRCVRKMSCGKQPGEDTFVVEALKYGGNALRQEVYKVVRTTWTRAAAVHTGDEATDWPPEWRIGLVVPLWKKKGSKRDRNTWRGIALLSVGSKFVARVVASRLSAWSEMFIGEPQSGFRRGRGTDDALLVTRRLLEEASVI